MNLAEGPKLEQLNQLKVGSVVKIGDTIFRVTRAMDSTFSAHNRRGSPANYPAPEGTQFRNLTLKKLEGDDPRKEIDTSTITQDVNFKVTEIVKL